jgi:outer membrane protein assembly factor BamB
VKNGVVYFGSRDSNFFAVDAATGKLKWELSDSGPVISASAISNNVVYFGTQNNFIYGLDANSGQLLWKNSTGKKDKDYITSPAISGNVLFAATHSGLVYAYSSEVESMPTTTVKETTATPTATNTASPAVSTARPSQTQKSPGFEYPVLAMLIMAAIIIYNKKK